MRRLILLLAITFLMTGLSFAKDDLITITQESEQVPLATSNSILVQSVCPDKNVVISGGGECLGFLKQRIESCSNKECYRFNLRHMERRVHQHEPWGLRSAG